MMLIHSLDLASQHIIGMLKNLSRSEQQSCSIGISVAPLPLGGWPSSVSAALRSFSASGKSGRNPASDNPFSEAQFKTLKYRPGFPERFGSAQHGRAHCGPFFGWYNHEHRHGGIGLLTPHDVHYGLADQRVAARTLVLAAAHAAHPERFSAGVPMPPPSPTAVWINPPTLTSPDVEEAH
jgi:Integrase core domain